jgi:hypothetical protein
LNFQKPDDEQRRTIARGCSTYSAHCGDIRCEAELLPQLWLQLEHKHLERRLLVAETAGCLAIGTTYKMHPILISICQQLLHDKESEVRKAAANSLSILSSFAVSKDKMSSLQSSCIQTIIDDTIPIQTGLLLLSVISQGMATKIHNFW